jgi:formate hydrogenlyase subunit 7
MSRWVVRGLRTGIKSTAYPFGPEHARGVTPGRPTGTEAGASAAAALAARCPTQALVAGDGRVAVDHRRCVHCYRCARGTDRPLAWEPSHEWAGRGDGIGGEAFEPFDGPFRHSIHILVVDAGDCGACLNEVKQLNNPYYNMHRLGFFVTPTPRHADVLLVVGAVTDHMRAPLAVIYAAMPPPKRVVAVGACALSGGVFAESFVCAKGVREVLPVDVEVPGNPPPPLAILHGLLVATGRKAPVPLGPATSEATTGAPAGQEDVASEADRRPVPVAASSPASVQARFAARRGLGPPT